jgi:hypothetical protein
MGNKTSLGIVLIGAFIFIFVSANQVISAQRGYLQTYKKDNFSDLSKVRFLNVNAPRSSADYVSWPEGEKDAVMSLKYRIPVGWYVCLYKGEKKDVSQHKCWAGTGMEESVTKESIPEFLHEKVTGHYYHR